MSWLPSLRPPSLPGSIPLFLPVLLLSSSSSQTFGYFLSPSTQQLALSSTIFKSSSLFRSLLPSFLFFFQFFPHPLSSVNTHVHDFACIDRFFYLCLVLRTHTHTHTNHFDFPSFLLYNLITKVWKDKLHQTMTSFSSSEHLLSITHQKVALELVYNGGN